MSDKVKSVPEGHFGPTPYLAVSNGAAAIDFYKKAVERFRIGGAKVLEPVADQFYGDRSAKIADPYGHLWFLATHKEDLAPEEIGRRAKVLFG